MTRHRGDHLVAPVGPPARRGASGHAVAPRSGRPAGHLSRPRAAPVEGVDDERRNVLRGGRRRNTATASRVLGPRPRYRVGVRPRPYTDERGRNGHEAGVTGRGGATGAIRLKSRGLICLGSCLFKKRPTPPVRAAAGRFGGHGGSCGAATGAMLAGQRSVRFFILPRRHAATGSAHFEFEGGATTTTTSHRGPTPSCHSRDGAAPAPAHPLRHCTAPFARGGRARRAARITRSCRPC